MSIPTTCMLVNLQIGQWTGHRLDKEASARVTTEAGADADAARVNKHLVPKESLKPIVQAAGAVRTHFYAKTLPWKDNGDRILPRSIYTQFIEEHGELLSKFRAAVDEFVDNTYATVRDRAEFRMGALFKDDDYPLPRSLRNRFYVNLDIDAVTEAKDFRVQMDALAVDVIRDNMERALTRRVANAMQDVWERLAKTVNYFAERMDGDAVFRDSTVNNLTEIVELLPALNITNDPNLERIRQEVLDKLGGIEPKDLRNDTLIRKRAAQEAKDIIANMSGFMKAFQAQED